MPITGVESGRSDAEIVGVQDDPDWVGNTRDDGELGRAGIRMWKP